MKENLPLISCLMVTRAINMNLIDCSIYSYVTQTYKNKELVIVTDCDLENLDNLKCLLSKYKDENIKLVYLNEKLIIGSLRNISIDNASGEYCIQWDDDDLYHNERIEKQYFAIISGDYDYCILKNFMMYFYNTHLLSMNCWMDDDLEGMPPSILFKKNIKFRYPPIEQGEDVAIFDTPDLKYCILRYMPCLYIYTYHGHNSFDYTHYLKLYNISRKTFNMNILEKIAPLFKHAGLDYTISY
jgi:glycosyltransferase involved in cell wall biosynthesis